MTAPIHYEPPFAVSAQYDDDGATFAETIRFSCRCDRDGVTGGSITTQTTMMLPWRAKLITVDACIATPLAWIWAAGIRTLGSCCGHGRGPGSIIIERDFVVLARLLGFDVEGEEVRLADDDYRTHRPS